MKLERNKLIFTNKTDFEVLRINVVVEVLLAGWLVG